MTDAYRCDAIRTPLGRNGGALMKEKYGVDSMPETAKNVATQFRIEREAQDRMSLASQQKAVAAQKSGYFDAEITPVTIAQEKGEPLIVAKDEHPRDTSLEALAKLKGVVATRCARCASAWARASR